MGALTDRVRLNDKGRMSGRFTAVRAFFFFSLFFFKEGIISGNAVDKNSPENDTKRLVYANCIWAHRLKNVVRFCRSRLKTKKTINRSAPPSLSSRNVILRPRPIRYRTLFIIL